MPGETLTGKATIKRVDGGRLAVGSSVTIKYQEGGRQVEIYEGISLGRSGDVDFDLTIPRNAVGVFTYSLVIFEGYATAPSMVKSESVVIVSA